MPGEHYRVSRRVVAASGRPAHLYEVGFGAPAQNDQLVREADELVRHEAGEGELALINGPASLPVACVLAHHLAHRYSAVGVYDPKLGSYVVAITHNPGLPLGALIEGAEVAAGE